MSVYYESFKKTVLDDGKSSIERGEEIVSAPLKALQLIDELQSQLDYYQSKYGDTE